MKIIISHDVDHLYASDHMLHDLIIPKLWIRSLFHLFQRKITLKVFLNRLAYPFKKKYNRIEEIIQKDTEYQVPSVFFFGMERGLGMSYGKRKAKKYVKYVSKSGFDVGVHGINFTDLKKIKQEYAEFKKIIQRDNFGMRMHYVRYTKDTFGFLDKTGYLYDSSEFDKKGIEFKKPYKVGNMWEFPLHIMDGYIIPVGNLAQGIENTKRSIKEAEKSGVLYCTILYHDFQYDEACYPEEKKWYDWLLEYLKLEKYNYISYVDAIKELETCYETGCDTVC